MKPYYQERGITIYHSDCRELLSLGFSASCVCSDPPWGADTNVDSKRFSKKASDFWGCTDRSRIRTHEKVRGDNEPFNPLPWIEKPAILWGGNHFASRLPNSGGWLIWDKRWKIEEIADKGWPLGEAELAWTNVIGTTRVFRNRWAGLLRSTEQGEFYHPTQKPVELMEWCIQFLPAEGAILDPYMGSGTMLIAAKRKGREAIGIELHEPYCETAAQRLSQEVFDFNQEPSPGVPGRVPDEPVQARCFVDDEG